MDAYNGSSNSAIGYSGSNNAYLSDEGSAIGGGLGLIAGLAYWGLAGGIFGLLAGALIGAAFKEEDYSAEIGQKDAVDFLRANPDIANKLGDSDSLKNIKGLEGMLKSGEAAANEKGDETLYSMIDLYGTDPAENKGQKASKQAYLSDNADYSDGKHVANGDGSSEKYGGSQGGSETTSDSNESGDEGPSE